MQAHYKSQGYTIAGDGAVEFYFVAFRTHLRTNVREICVNGSFAWSNDLHDPARTLQGMRQQDKEYRYSRLGPYPRRGPAEQKAAEVAIQYFSDATRYGIWGTGGLRDIGPQHYRDPRFR